MTAFHFGSLAGVLGLFLHTADIQPPLRQGEAASRVKIEAQPDHIDFKVAGSLVGRYQIAKSYTKPIFWPLLAPGGAHITRDWPMGEAKPSGSKDHPHQKSAWFCHGDVIPEGIELKSKIKGVDGVDFWSEAKGHGWIVCTDVATPKINGSRGRLDTHNEWRTSEGAKIMEENRSILLYDLGRAHLLVLDIDLEASICPITFGDTKEGALGIRINDDIRADRGKGTIQNAEGKLNEKGCWGQISAWCDYSGPLNDKIVGLTLLSDPKNPYPACWHSRGYGLMAANPFGRTRAAFPAVKGRHDLVHLAKGEHLRLRYGILLHEGNAETGQIADAYKRFVALREGEKQ